MDTYIHDDRMSGHVLQADERALDGFSSSHHRQFPATTGNIIGWLSTARDLMFPPEQDKCAWKDLYGYVSMPNTCHYCFLHGWRLNQGALRAIGPGCLAYSDLYLITVMRPGDPNDSTCLIQDRNGNVPDRIEALRDHIEAELTPKWDVDDLLFNDFV